MSFIVSEVQPTLFNSGLKAGTILSSYNGPTTITTNSAVIENKIFNSVITIAAKNVVIRNCKQIASYTGLGNGGLFTMTAEVCENILFENVSICPTTPGDRYNSLYGHDFTARNCHLKWGVDGVGVANKYGPRVNVNLLNNYFDEQAWFSDDRGAHTDGTHNDHIQHHSGQGLWVVGNYFCGTRKAFLGTAPTPQTSQIMLSQTEAYYDTGDVHFNYNFIAGGSEGVKVKSKSSNGQPRTVDFEAWGNRWVDDNQRYTVARNFFIDPGVRFNGFSYPGMPGAGAADVKPANGGNTYAHTALVAEEKRGRPVNVVCTTAG